MKHTYQIPEVDWLTVEEQDVIATSGTNHILSFENDQTVIGAGDSDSWDSLT